jgi:predicted Zn-dependent peptidase
MRVDRSRLPDVGPDPSFSFPAIATHRLQNGLEVRTVEHVTVPIITFVLQVSDGSAADPPDRHGLAALTADMLDEGTGDLSAIDVSEALARIGAEFDTDIGADATALSVTTLTRFAERGARLLADIVTRPSLRGEDFLRVRQLRLDRLRQLRDLPPAVADRAFLRLVYRDHPYGHLAIGSDAALRATELDDVRRFHDQVYRPSRATLVVVGALPHDELRTIAERAFLEWRDPSVRAVSGWPDALETDPLLVPAARLAVVPRELAAQSELRLGHLSAKRDTPDYPALLVMNAVLGGQFVSRVNLKLREEKGYTYGARTGFDWRRGMAPFSLQASVHTAATADAIKDSLNELSAIRGARPADEREMTLAKATLTRGYPRNFETTQQVARSIAQLALYGLPDTYFEEFVPRVNAIQAQDVTRVARSYLDPSRLVTLIVGDHRAIGGSLASLQLGEPAVLSPDV